MALIKEAATLELIWDIIRGKTEGISKVTFFPQKPKFPWDLPYEQPFWRATPESQGVESERIREMFRAFGREKSIHLHSIMVLKNGKVIGETSFYPYQKWMWHTTYSMCKSIVSMAIGFLIQEGKISLNTKVVDIFKKNVNLIGILKLKSLSVEHLLTMTSGVGFNETGAISGNDWVKSFLDAPLLHEPGEVFEYNSMNTYMLSAIVTEVTGERLVDYLKPRLFEPLGITKVFWESCPKGITKGGWGLFLCPEDMAKLGQLYLQKGEWNHIQILPKEWIEQSTSKKLDTPKSTGFAGYGYQIWTGQREGHFAFNGMMGQNVFVYPDVQMVIVTTAGNQEFFASNAMMDILAQYLPGKGESQEPLPENLREHQKLLDLEWNFSHPKVESGKIRGGWCRKTDYRTKNRKKIDFRKKDFRKEACSLSWHQKARELDGKRYELSAAYIGLFPLMGQVFHNNYTDGIKEIGFSVEEGKFFMSVLEGEDEKKMELGMEEARIMNLELHGETYCVAVEGSFGIDEDGREVLKIVISYLEDAMKRVLKIFFEEDRIELCATESPGKGIILNGISSVAGELMENPILKKFTEKGNVNVIQLLMESAIGPKVDGVEKEPVYDLDIRTDMETQDTEEIERGKIEDRKETGIDTWKGSETDTPVEWKPVETRSETDDKNGEEIEEKLERSLLAWNLLRNDS